MAHVALEFGPPAARGVTTLMSVGDGLQTEAPPLEAAVNQAIWASAGLMVYGFASGNRTVRDAGGGGLLALLLAKWWGKR
jgi:hypothetical protein